MPHMLISLLVFFISSLHAEISNKSQHVSIQLQYYDQFQFAGYYIAKEKGFYKEVGLDVEIKKYTPDIVPINEVLEGRANYGVGRSSMIIDRVQGKKIVPLAAILQSSPQILLAISDSNITKLSDIKNKKLMITHASLDSVPIQVMLNSHKLRNSDFKTIMHNYNLQNLIDGKVDIMSAYISNEPYALEKLGFKPVIFNPYDYGFEFYEDILFTDEKEFELNPQRVESFKEASLKGWRYAFENIEESVNIILKKYNTQNKTKKALIYEAHMLKELAYKEGISLGDIDIKKQMKIFDIYRVMGFIKEKIDFKQISYKYKDINLKLTKSEKSYLKNKKTITMCVDPNWLPYESIKNGQYKGIGADIIKILEKKLDVSVNLVQTHSWKESIIYAKDRKCDILPMAMQTPSRKKYLKFTKPYLKFPMVLMTTTEKMFFDNAKDLAGKKIAIVKNYAIGEILKKKYRKIKFIDVDCIDEAFDLVKNKSVFGYIDSLATIRYIIGKKNAYESVKISGKLDESVKLAIGVRNDDDILFNTLFKGINSINKLEVDNVINNHVNIVNDKKVNYRLIWKLIIGFILILSLMVWAYRKLELSKEKLEQIVVKEVENSRQKDRQILEQSRLAQMGEMISMIAHQWRQPLAAIASTGADIKLSMMLQKYDLEDKNQRDEFQVYMYSQIDKVEKYVKSLTETIDDFRNFYKPNKESTMISINSPLEKSLDILNSVLIENNIKVQVKLKSKKKLRLFQNELMQVFINIIKNSIDNFIEKEIKSGEIVIKSKDTKRGVEVTIYDNGGGISESIIGNVFDPYFSTKDEKNGTGLGLYMSKIIVQEHHRGVLSVKNKNSGACFKIEIVSEKNES
jgi:signal transduction histidine kinase/ABC-type nitrate/sulfonate/bicarbonate transport system substrate-binding protein